MSLRNLHGSTQIVSIKINYLPGVFLFYSNQQNLLLKLIHFYRLPLIFYNKLNKKVKTSKSLMLVISTYIYKVNIHTLFSLYIDRRIFFQLFLNFS